MSQERDAFIKEQVAAGVAKEEIRRQLISHGFGSEGFEESYANIAGPESVHEAVEATSAEAAPTQNPANPVVETVFDSGVHTSAQTGKIISLGRLISASFDDVKTHHKRILEAIGVFFALFVAGTVLVFGAMFVMFTIMTSTFSTGSVVLFGGLAILFYIAILLASFAAGGAVLRIALHPQEDSSFWRQFIWVFKHLWPLLLVMLYSQLAVMTGFVLLILPGLVLAWYLSMTMPVYLKEGIRGMDALTRSIELVKGHWWGVFGRLFVMALLIGFVYGIGAGLLSAAFGSFLGVIGELIAGVTIMMLYVVLIFWFSFAIARLYESLAVQKPVEQFHPEAYGGTKNLLRVFILIGPVLFIALNVWVLALVQETQRQLLEEMPQVPVTLDEIEL